MILPKPAGDNYQIMIASSPLKNNKNKQMKKLISLLMIGISVVLGFNGCSKVFEIHDPTVEVKDIYISDTLDADANLLRKVTFTLDGNADVISFYSGETGSDYAYHNGRIEKLLDLNLSFLTSCDAGVQGPDMLSVMASSDFSGALTPEAVQAATWTDITNRFNISPIVTNIDLFTSSGKGDIRDLTGVDKPIYLAFKYAVQPQRVSGSTTITNAYSRMRIRGWEVSSTTETATATLSTFTSAFASAGWKYVEIGEWRTGRNTITSSQIQLRGNHATGAGLTAEHLETYMEAWAICLDPISAGDVDLGPDRPLVIKSYVDDPVRTYSFVYKDPGEYEAVFVLSNVNASDEKKTIKKVKVVIP